MSEPCPTNDPATTQQRAWTSYVMTVDATSWRTLRAVELLNGLSISTHLFQAIPAHGSSEMDKVRSNYLTQRGIYDAIARSPGPADEYVLLFEDDVMLAPAVRTRASARRVSLSPRLKQRSSPRQLARAR